ncbi:hypothetical protein D3C81_1898050 [compost metagenome]
MHLHVVQGAGLILEQIDAAGFAGAWIFGPDLGDEAGLPGDGLRQRHRRLGEGRPHHGGGEVEMDLQQTGHGGLSLRVDKGLAAS